VHANAAQVLALGHHDVAVGAPTSAPRVLNNPVRSATSRGETDGQDGVVEVLATWAREDTRAVRLETTRRIDGDTDGCLVNLSAQNGLSSTLLRWVWLDDWLAGLLASLSSSSVWVVGFTASTVLGEPVDGLVVPATVASLVAHGSGAVNELLLGERWQSAGGDLGPAFDNAGGGESPT